LSKFLIENMMGGAVINNITETGIPFLSI